MARGWVKVLRGTAIWTGRVLLGFVAMLTLAVGFGTPAEDAQKLRVFNESVGKWQKNPDFRKVQVEYVDQGSDSMRTHFAFCETTKGIMFLRSLPGLPDHLKVNDTSLNHYINFTRGPLSAYMHLTTEQGMDDTLKMLKDLGAKTDPTDADIREFLHQYKMHNPVVDDAGACASVRSLLRDVDPGRGFVVKDNVAAKLRPHIVAVATSLGYPTNPADMTPAQQMRVWTLLDAEVKETDYELWRTKQVNDWLNGVWAQVYGTMYASVIGPSLTVREVSRIAGPLMVIALAGLMVHRKRRKLGVEETGLPGQLAMEGGKPDGEA